MLAARLVAAVELDQPWPHAIIDDFLPAPIFDELADALPEIRSEGKTKKMPASVLELLRSPEVEDAIRDRFRFTGAKPTIELTHRVAGVRPHGDRSDKLWAGILYIAGDPKQGTDLYDATGALAKRVEFRPNRLLCWGRNGAQHAVPAGYGRWAVQWWFLK